MKIVSNLLTWWKTTFAKQNSAGKLLFGGVSLLVFCCLCSIPVSLLSPNTPANVAATVTKAEVPTVEPAQTATQTFIPTYTFTPTSMVQPTLAGTLQPKFIPSHACVPTNPPQNGFVVEVVDGDTIRARLDDGKVYSVRYIGMDTPETRGATEPFGAEASQKNKELVFARDVTLIKDVRETDNFGRLLRYVFVGDKFVNHELVKQGYATPATYPPDVACATLFQQAKQYAQANLLGLWGVATATPPSKSNTGSLEIIAVDKRAEYADIKNTGSVTIDLVGWALLSEKGNQRCSLKGEIEPGAVLRIWAMSGSPGFSCGYSTNIWNNSESDPAVLLNPQGQEVDRY